ncbi:hypothetical protein Tco_0166679, partial [Tanacetum coccineum]
HTTEEVKSVGFGAYWAESTRQIPDKGDLTLLGGVRHLRRYLMMFASGRKREAMISRGQFHDDTWAWVALGPEKYPDVAAGASEIAEGAHDVDEGAQAVLAPVQAPQPPPAAGPTRTMA